MKWLGSHRSFVVETFFTNSGSITSTQRLFRTHFKLGRHDPVPSRNTILLWIKNFRKKWICTKTTIDRPTSDFHNSRKCNGSKIVSSTISTTFCEKTRSCFEDLRNQRKKNSSQRTANASVQDYVGTRTKRK